MFAHVHMRCKCRASGERKQAANVKRKAQLALRFVLSRFLFSFLNVELREKLYIDRSISIVRQRQLCAL
jgi:hypothetical protein